MVLSYSWDPFCCFTTSMDIATFFDCHRRAFAHFGGVGPSYQLKNRLAAMDRESDVA
jgi:hypothetical protein